MIWRVTFSTSQSPSITCTGKRPIRRCRLGMPDRADWPVPTKSSLPLKCLDRVSVTSCTWNAFSASSPMYCCTSSSTTSVSGNLPSSASAASMAEVIWSLRDVCDLWELLLQQLSGVGLGVSQVGSHLQQRLGQVAGHVHVRQLLRQRAACSLQLGLDGGRRPSRFIHICNCAWLYCSGRPLDLNTMPSSASRTLSPAPSPACPLRRAARRGACPGC
jgi:hypothetical protein